MKIKHDDGRVVDWITTESVDGEGRVLGWGKEENKIRKEYYKHNGWSLVEADTMKIKHSEHGEVVGAVPGKYDGEWCLRGRDRVTYFYCSDGWSLVSEKKWVTIQVEREQWRNVAAYSHVHSPMGHYSAEWRYPE